MVVMVILLMVAMVVPGDGGDGGDAQVKAKAGGHVPTLGIICGSGLGELAAVVERPVSIVNLSQKHETVAW